MKPIEIMRTKPAGGGGGGGTWQTVRTTESTGLLDSSGWAFWTGRQVLAASSLTDLSASKIRISVKSASAVQLKIAKMYVGFKSGTYDYTATPTQVLFSGSGSVTIPANTVQVSDEVTFAYDGTSDLVIGIYSDDTSSYRASTTTGRGEVYQKNADDAATVSPTGFSVGGIHDFIWLVEAFG